jgi:hypothetical protein
MVYVRLIKKHSLIWKNQSVYEIKKSNIRKNKSQRINRLLNIYTQFQGLGFFSGMGFIKEIEALSDLKRELAKCNPNDLPEVVNDFKTQEKYKDVFEGNFKDQIQVMLDELITKTPQNREGSPKGSSELHYGDPSLC